jgi:hypothetical protein
MDFWGLVRAGLPVLGNMIAPGVGGLVGGGVAGIWDMLTKQGGQQGGGPNANGLDPQQMAAVQQMLFGGTQQGYDGLMQQYQTPLAQSNIQVGPSAATGLTNALGDTNVAGLEAQASRTFARNSRMLDGGATANGSFGSGLADGERRLAAQDTMAQLAGAIDQSNFQRGQAANQFGLGRAGLIDNMGQFGAQFGLQQTQANNNTQLQQMAGLQALLSGLDQRNLGTFSAVNQGNQFNANLQQQANQGNQNLLGGLGGGLMSLITSGKLDGIDFLKMLGIGQGGQMTNMGGGRS